MAAITVEQALQLAFSHHQAGRLAEAEATCRQILAAKAGDANTLHLLGVILGEMGRHEEALEFISKAIVGSRQPAICYSNLGVCYRRLDRLHEAVDCFQRALAMQPNLSDAHYNLGEALWLLGDLPGAIACFRRAVAIKPDFAKAHYNLGSVLFASDRLKEAQGCFERAIALKPDYTEAHGNLGSVFLEQGKFAEGLAAYRCAVACQPDSAAMRWNLAIALLLQGQYAEGWREHEWRLQRPDFSYWRFSQPRWNGSPAAGQTILLHSEQGYGDTIQFLRYVPLVRERAPSARLVLRCPAAMSDLVRQSVSGVEFIIGTDVRDECARLAFDYHVPLLSLPHVLGVFEPLRLAVPYLRVDPHRRAFWAERLGPGERLKVGLAWAGNPKHARHHRRSMDVARLLPLLNVVGVQCYSLQVDHAGAAPPQLIGAGLIDPTDRITDFADSAALVSELDLVISVDTATAHLAGALGRPVWTLLPLYPDWRWGLEREDTLWYPTMRLFRQKTAGDWDEVIQRVAGELAVLARAQAGCGRG